eukprot:TRINITY_DN1402_c0_g1_i1.p1 TRINITY_DN1402_c0_g1~~TRINITY_DN1402_c0_g1_i1.p1  ORF type:complete len:279 (-),score=57.64 TRINITY_DN1402_c0_g1_i1:40-876(-)
MLRRRRASELQVNDPNQPKRPKRGKTHTYNNDEIENIATLLASNWSPDMVTEYYLKRDDMNVRRRDTENVIATLLNTDRIAQIRGSPEFAPIGNDALLQVRRHWNGEIPGENPVEERTDEEIIASWKVISKKRKSLNFKPLVFVRGLQIRILWDRENRWSLKEIRAVALDSTSATSTLNFRVYNRPNKDVLRSVILAHQTDDEPWSVLPHGHYIDMYETVNIKLPFKIRWNGWNFVRQSAQQLDMDNQLSSFRYFDFDIVDGNAHLLVDHDESSEEII